MVQHVVINGEYRGVRLEPTKERCVDQCGAKCCKNPGYSLRMGTKEMRRLKELSPEIKMLAEGKDTWLMLFGEEGCPFLDGALCTIYEDRPEACRRYPVTRDDICFLWLKKAPIAG